MGLPDFFRAFHNKRRGVFVKLVDMRLQPAVFGFFEQKGEGVVELAGAQPDIAVGPGHDVRLENLGKARAHFGVKAVAGDDEVGIGKVQVRIGVLFEQELDTQRLATRLQNIE